MKSIMFFLVMIISSCVNAAPDFKFPFSDSEKWYVRLAYDSDPFHHGKDLYAIDFTQSGCSAWNKDVLSSARGIITKTGYSGSYGNHVIVSHGNGYETLYAHLESITAIEGNPICQGCKIGTVGNTGSGVFGDACKDHKGTHLHYVAYHNGLAYKPEPLSGYININAGNWYTSNNSEPEGIYLGSTDFIEECINTVPYNTQCNIDDT